VTVLATSSVAFLACLSGCGGTGHHELRHTPLTPPPALAQPRRARARLAPARSPLQALVTAQSADRLLVVDLRTGRVLRRISIPGDPGYVSAIGSGGPVVVASSATGTVTLLGGAHYT